MRYEVRGYPALGPYETRFWFISRIVAIDYLIRGLEVRIIDRELGTVTYYACFTEP